MYVLHGLFLQECPAVYVAAASGHAHLLPILAAGGANMDARVRSTGASALHIAAATGQESAVIVLLQLQANTSAKVSQPGSPMLPENQSDALRISGGFKNALCIFGSISARVQRMCQSHFGPFRNAWVTQESTHNSGSGQVNV